MTTNQLLNEVVTALDHARAQDDGLNETIRDVRFKFGAAYVALADGTVLTLTAKELSKRESLLVVVDVQNDFMPGGALGVPGGDEIREPIQQLIDSPKFDLRVCTGDSHPWTHCSFEENGGKWPAHCVTNTVGAQLALIDTYGIQRFVWKGLDASAEEYSGWGPTSDWLRNDSLAVRKVYVCGLATDYCVKATALDAAKEGYEVYVILDCCRAVAPDTEAEALKEMRAAGVRFTLFADVLGHASPGYTATVK